MKIQYIADISGAFGRHNKGEIAEGSREDFKILLEKGWVIEVKGDKKDENEVQPRSVPSDSFGTPPGNPSVK